MIFVFSQHKSRSTLELASRPAKVSHAALPRRRPGAWLGRTTAFTRREDEVARHPRREDPDGRLQRSAGAIRARQSRNALRRTPVFCTSASSPLEPGQRRKRWTDDQGGLREKSR